MCCINDCMVISNLVISLVPYRNSNLEQTLIPIVITFQDPLYITHDQRDKIEGVTSVQKNFRDLQPLGSRKIMDVETGYRNFNAGYQALANSLIIGGMLFLTKFIWKWFDFHLIFLNFVTCTKFGIKKFIKIPYFRE